LAGANLIYGLGMLESGVTIDYAQLVMDAEFLSHDDTYAGMRTQSRSKLIDRRVREEWAADGSTTLYDRSLAEARRILETHRPTPLPEAVAAELKSIIDAAERELNVH
jgi:trimethylamine--corrinoid protein Co-methyltransferase